MNGKVKRISILPVKKQADYVLLHIKSDLRKGTLIRGYAVVFITLRMANVHTASFFNLSRN